jgi:acyl-CoA thioesterase
MTSTRMKSNGTSDVVTPAVAALQEADKSLATFGIRVCSAHDGHAVLVTAVDEAFTNGHGIAHGGLLFALADTALAFAANSLVPGTVTAESSIIYLAPAAAGEELVAVAAVRSVTGRHTVIDVTVRSGEKVVAEFRGRGTARRGGQG